MLLWLLARVPAAGQSLAASVLQWHIIGTQFVVAASILGAAAPKLQQWPAALTHAAARSQPLHGPRAQRNALQIYDFRERLPDTSKVIVASGSEAGASAVLIAARCKFRGRQAAICKDEMQSHKLLDINVH